MRRTLDLLDRNLERYLGIVPSELTGGPTQTT